MKTEEDSSYIFRFFLLCKFTFIDRLFKKLLLLLLRNKQFWICAIAFSVPLGVYESWQVILDINLDSKGISQVSEPNTNCLTLTLTLYITLTFTLLSTLTLNINQNLKLIIILPQHKIDVVSSISKYIFNHKVNSNPIFKTI